MSSHAKTPFRCNLCGEAFASRISDILRTGQTSCNLCCRKEVMRKRVKTDAWKKHQVRMTERSVECNTKDKKYIALRKRCNAVKNRCTCPTSAKYPYYGGRGIEFRFASPVVMAEWIIDNLGYPKRGESIDRIDNIGHYEPGNIRWATQKIQNGNKRDYVVDGRGERIRNLRAIRTDYTYETIRTLVDKGLSDDQIINRKKWKQQQP